MATWAKRFVCVRIQSMNDVNLEAFPFEYDLTWMSFFQDAHGRTYARYGGRDDKGPESYLNQESLIATMKKVLALHEDHAVQRASRYEPVPSTKQLPTQLPTMRETIGKRKESCIHCHDVKVARLQATRQEGTLRKDMVFTYPSPSQLGLILDPRQQNRIAQVEPNSVAAAAGLAVGDRLQASEGQRLLTYGDFTRVLELAPADGSLPLTVSKDGQTVETRIALQDGWRVSTDPSWRASLHVVGPGAGFWGRPANTKEREQLNLGPDELALKVTFVWAPHAKAANVCVGDVVVNLDGNQTNMDMRQCHGFLHLHRNWGDAIQMQVLRNGKPVRLAMQLPAGPPEE